MYFAVFRCTPEIAANPPEIASRTEAASVRSKLEYPPKCSPPGAMNSNPVTNKDVLIGHANTPPSVRFPRPTIYPSNAEAKKTTPTIADVRTVAISVVLP